MLRLNRSPAKLALYFRAVALPGLLSLGFGAPAWAQTSFEGCTALALARSVAVRPDGTFLLDNVPAGGRIARVTVTCPTADGALHGASALVEIPTNGLVDIGHIDLKPASPGVAALSVSAAPSTLTEPGSTSQLTVTAILPDGTTRDVTVGSSGTLYTSSNLLVAHVDGEGRVTATIHSGTAVISVTHQGILAAALITVNVGDIGDGDGLPDDFEATFACLNPAGADAEGDPDADGRTNLQEFSTGTDPCVADTDGDGLNDGQEAAIGSNPVLPDSDLDGLLDGQEPNPSGNGDGDGLINVLDPDQDNDGLRDGIEVRICGSPTCANPNSDNDGDGLSNLDEVQLGTDPTRADTDGDGLTDSAEVLGGTDPINPDMDGDGFPDGFEVTLGSDPKDPASRPTPPPITEVAGRPFSILNAGSPPTPASAEAVGRTFSVLNTASPAAPASLEAAGRAFSLLNQAGPAAPASLEAAGRIFSLLNSALPPAPASTEAVGRTFSLLNQAGPPPPSSAEAVGRLFSVRNMVPP